MRKQAVILWVGMVSLCEAGTVGLWRFDEGSATAGQALATAVNQESPGTLDAPVSGGSPVYSTDIPDAEIFDPMSGRTYANAFSVDLSAANSQFLTDNAAAFNTSFTLEFFVKYVGEPGGFESLFRREEAVDLAWRIDFDHSLNQSFGKIRTRWDTPAVPANNVAEAGVDENVNFVLRAQDISKRSMAYIDTGAKDASGVDVGPQNTGNPADYIYDAASANPSEVDVALQGDGINDVPTWHHVALSFDESTGQIRLFFDYRLAQTRTLSDSQGNGYTHPAAGLNFGKLAASSKGLLLDEVRYSNEILDASEFLRASAILPNEVFGHWRFDEQGAVGGGSIVSAVNAASELRPAAPTNGTPTYSADVPAAVIYDPMTDTSFTNQFSFDASADNSRFQVENEEGLNTSFSVEFFIKLIGEPGGYHAYVRRQQVGDLRWQIDFDHAGNGAFGRVRTRFDTPAGEPDGNSQAGVDENSNFVVGPTGGGAMADALRLWIDTDPGDGMAASYDDPTDWALDGDGLNDNPSWHHVAITFDEELGVIRFYYDYQLMQTRTLSDSEGNGYIHPDSFLEFGKLSGGAYAVLFDEVRYSSDILLPFQFLRAEVVEVSGPVISTIGFDAVTGNPGITWSAMAGQEYTIQRSTNLAQWDDLSSNEVATGSSASFTDFAPLQDAERVFYRVIQNP